jgi:hypothetical protein
MRDSYPSALAHAPALPRRPHGRDTVQTMLAAALPEVNWEVE